MTFFTCASIRFTADQMDLEQSSFSDRLLKF